MDEPDLELLRAWRTRGDRNALQTLVNRHLARVHHLMMRLVLHWPTADDLTQEVFLRVTRKLETFSADAKFSTWLYRIALNVAYSHLEQAARRRAESLDVLSSPAAGAQHEPGARLLSVERIGVIEEALAALPAKRRAALVLVCLEGKSIAEAAAIEGCPPQTIHSRLHEARRQLKHQLKDLLT